MLAPTQKADSPPYLQASPANEYFHPAQMASVPSRYQLFTEHLSTLALGCNERHSGPSISISHSNNRRRAKYTDDTLSTDFYSGDKDHDDHGLSRRFSRSPSHKPTRFSNSQPISSSPHPDNAATSCKDQRKRARIWIRPASDCKSRNELSPAAHPQLLL